MSRQPQPAKIRQKLASDLAKTLGLSYEAALEMIPEEQIITKGPVLETEEEKILEAQAVLTYFYDRGNHFFVEICRTCKQSFAYSYSFTGVKYCSIICINEALKEAGLHWSIDRPLSERYGKYAPAVVPAVAYEIVNQKRNQIDEPVDSLELPDLDGLLADLGL